MHVDFVSCDFAENVYKYLEILSLPLLFIMLININCQVPLNSSKETGTFLELTPRKLNPNQYYKSELVHMCLTEIKTGYSKSAKHHLALRHLHYLRHGPWSWSTMAGDCFPGQEKIPGLWVFGSRAQSLTSGTKSRGTLLISLRLHGSSYL